jgi:hypothetical protein
MHALQSTDPDVRRIERTLRKLEKRAASPAAHRSEYEQIAIETLRLRLQLPVNS